MGYQNNSQVLVSAPPVQAYFLSPDQLTKKGLFGGAMREVLEASQGKDVHRSFASACISSICRCKLYYIRPAQDRPRTKVEMTLRRLPVCM